MNLIDQYLKFANYNKNCRIKCVYDVLHCVGYDIGMDSISLLSSEYYISSYLVQNVNKIPLIGVSMSLPFFEKKVFECFGLKTIELTEQETQTVYDIKRLLQEQKIIIIYFDTAELLGKYNESMLRYNMLTSGIILDADEKNNTITLNSLASNNKKLNVFDFDLIQKARRSKIIPISPCSRAFYLDTRVIQTKYFDEKEKIALHLKELADEYLKVEKNVYEDKYEYYVGQAAYRKIYDYFGELQKQLRYSKQSQEILNRIVYIITKVFMRTLVGSTKSFYREEFSKALSSYADRYHMKNYKGISRRIFDSSKEWRKFIYYLNGVNKINNDSIDFVQALIDQLKTIQFVEDGILNDLRLIC